MSPITGIFGHCAKNITISGCHIRAAGPNAVQEVAFTLADGTAYVPPAIDSGLSVDDFAPSLSSSLTPTLNS